MTEVRVILVNTSYSLLEQIDEKLVKFVLEKLKSSGVEFIMNTKVNGATANNAKLDSGTTIPCHTLVWSNGITPSKLIANLPCDYDRGHRIIANSYLDVSGFEGEVYVLRL